MYLIRLYIAQNKKENKMMEPSYQHLFVDLLALSQKENSV